MKVDQLLLERWKNLIGPSSRKEREKYKDEVWKVLQTSYATSGGLKTSGFSSPDEMVESIPFWKLGIRSGKVKCVKMYKDKQGRKFVASGTDGSEEGKQLLIQVIKDDIFMQRSYGEVSKAVLGMIMKRIPWDVLESFLIPPSELSKIMRGQNIQFVKDITEDEWGDEIRFTLNKFPMLVDYGYLRTFTNGETLFKIAVGKPHLHIL